MPEGRSMAWFWRQIATSADRARQWITRPLGNAVYRLDRRFVDLHFYALDKADPRADGIPF